jgi:hypothetical protein
MALGSWLSSIVDAIGGVVAGDGNTPGTPDTRKYGYDPVQVGQAAAVILTQPAPANVQSEILVLAVAGVGLILLLRQGD